jgi:hypothetical protein
MGSSSESGDKCRDAAGDHQEIHGREARGSPQGCGHDTGGCQFLQHISGLSAILATATFIVDNRRTEHVAYPVVVDMKLSFVKGQNPIKGQTRLYWVAGWAIQGEDRSGIQSFLDSFELR